MDKDPVFDQTFLFNLTGVETDLHLRVYDSELLSDSYIGRMDSSIVELLKAGGGAKTYDLFDPENFRKVTGKIDISVRFDGSGGPAEVAELAPIMGPFHFQHNMTGLLVHPAASRAVGDKLALKVGGMNDYGIAFEFQPIRGLYVTALVLVPVGVLFALSLTPAARAHSASEGGSDRAVSTDDLAIAKA
jgi:hypothetical protein